MACEKVAVIFVFFQSLSWCEGAWFGVHRPLFRPHKRKPPPTHTPSLMLFPITRRPRSSVFVLAVLLLLADQEDNLATILDGDAEVEGLPAPEAVERGGLRDQIP